MAGALINLEWPGETLVIIASQDDITMNDPLYVSLSLSLSLSLVSGTQIPVKVGRVRQRRH